MLRALNRAAIGSDWFWVLAPNNKSTANNFLSASVEIDCQIRLENVYMVFLQPMTNVLKQQHKD